SLVTQKTAKLHPRKEIEVVLQKMINLIHHPKNPATHLMGNQKVTLKENQRADKRLGETELPCSVSPFLKSENIVKYKSLHKKHKNTL
ncbi:MAG: hypothetical protein RR203_02250, partial [Synergistaceae bacterium]